MKIYNENVSCDTCKHYVSPRKTSCRKCLNRNGYPGWEPAPGIKVHETGGWTFSSKGKPIETIFRTVVNKTREEI